MSLEVLLIIAKPTRNTHSTATLIDNIYLSKNLTRDIQTSILVEDLSDHWSFVEKTSVKQDLKHKVCSNFQISFLHLVRWTLPIGEALGQVDFFVRSLGQADLWSDVPQGRDILWPSVLLLQSGWLLVRCTPQGWGFGSGWHLVRLDQADLWSDVPPCRDILWPSVYTTALQSGWPLVRHTPHQRHLVGKCYYFSQVDLGSDMYPQAETSCGQLCDYFSQVDLWSDIPPRMRLWVRLTFSHFGSGQPLVRCTPRQRHLVAKCVTTFVRLTSGQMYPHWQRHLVAYCVTTVVRLTSGQTYPPRWGFGSGLHLVRLQVRLTFGDTTNRVFSSSISYLSL